jgi:hypothetical protein
LSLIQVCESLCYKERKHLHRISLFGVLVWVVVLWWGSQFIHNAHMHCALFEASMFQPQFSSTWVSRFFTKEDLFFVLLLCLKVSSLLFFSLSLKSRILFLCFSFFLNSSLWYWYYIGHA